MNELESLRRRLETLEAQRRRPARWVIVAATLVLVALPAWSQLSTFNPNQPAVASQINANFNQLKTWIEQKVGPVGSAAVTLSAPVSGNGFISGANLAMNTVAGSNIAAGTIPGAALGNGIISNANLNSELSCPDAAARASYGGCVFYLPATGGPYIYTYSQAATACRAQSARLCLYHEIGAFQAAGLERCAFGWVGDRADNATAYRVYPMQTTVAGCGSAGLTGGTVAMSTLAGAWCCKN